MHSHAHYTCTLCNCGYCIHVHENLCWIKILPSPATFVLQKTIVEKFRQCGKGCHILYVIFNTGRKIKIFAN